MDKLALEKIFSVAVKREIEAHEFYKGVSAKVEKGDVRKVFEQLAEEEMKHMELLEKLKADPTMILKFEQKQADYKVAEATELPTLSLAMPPKDAIALAMKKEQEAMEFYRKMAQDTDDEEVNKIFVQLSNMELAHKQRLENVFVEIGYPEVF